MSPLGPGCHHVTGALPHREQTSWRPLGNGCLGQDEMTALAPPASRRLRSGVLAFQPFQCRSHDLVGSLALLFLRSVRRRARVAHQTFRSAEAPSRGDASVSGAPLPQLVLRHRQTVQSFVMARLVLARPGHPRNWSTVGADSVHARHKAGSLPINPSGHGQIADVAFGSWSP
jgi:hypothetical protein